MHDTFPRCLQYMSHLCFLCPSTKNSKQLLAGKTGSAHIMTKVDFPRQFRFPSGIVKLINCTKSTRNFICHKKNKRVFLYFLFGHVFDNHMIFRGSEFYEVKKYVLSITLLKAPRYFSFLREPFLKTDHSRVALLKHSFLSRF